jgi:hypothetical protein
MNKRTRLSDERFYRCFSASLALFTALLLIPADWIQLKRRPDEPREPEPREIKIVRLPPEEIPPPPPLPERPKPKPKPKPPEPEPRPPEPKLEPMLEMPEIEIPKERQQERRLELQHEVAKVDLRRNMDDPTIDVPRDQRPQDRPMEVIAAERPAELEAHDQPLDVTVPREVPRLQDQPRVEVAAATTESFHDADAPDVNVVTPRPAARRSDRPALQPVSRQLKTGVSARMAEDAPDVPMPTGNTSRANQNAALAVSGPVEGTRVTYDDNPGTAHQVAVASPNRSSGNGAAPQLAVTSGGASGLAYSAAPADVAVGGVPGAQPGEPGGTKLGRVAAALSSKYGLPLIKVSDLGRRSTEAARWNILLPQISDLVRKTRGKNNTWKSGSGKNVVSVTRDGDALIIRYRDGITHVLIPTPNGLTSMYVSATSGARPVVSKVEEAEQAKQALILYDRGAS